MQRAAVCLGMVLALAGCRGSSPRLSISPSNLTLRADGFSTARVEVRSSAGLPPNATVEVIRGERSVRVESALVEGNRLEAILRAGVMPGDAAIEVRAPGYQSAALTVRLQPDLADSDSDGTPDVLVLTDPSDRAAFSRWFSFLAEAQYATSPLPPEINDCAALVRFAYREALREHDGAWASALRLPTAPPMPGVRRYHYPYTPLGASLFRVTPPGGRPDPSAFAEFADAETLWRYNTWRVTRDIRHAEPGDLLFYRQLEQSMPFHVMVYAGPSQLEAAGDPLVVYHTGPTGKNPGEMRRLPIVELLRHPQPRWRPVPGNTNFLGVYRWNILKDS